MPRKTITKISPVVIFLACLSLMFAACSHRRAGGGVETGKAGRSEVYGPVEIAGRVESGAVEEGSGIAASRCLPDVLWTHNDSGDGPFLFAMDSTGRDLGTWRVGGADNVDWEDIEAYKDADGRCHLYIGDIGGPKKDVRKNFKIYRIAEPQPGGEIGTRKRPADAGTAEILTFTYPDGPNDAETLLVHPQTGDIFVVSKHRDKPAGVYRIAPDFGAAVVAQRVSDLTVPAIPNGFLTGGDIAPDGSRLVICDYFAAYEFVLPPGAASFDEIWKQKPAIIDLGDRSQGEAIAYSADGKTLYATSEGVNQPLLRVRSK